MTRGDLRLIPQSRESADLLTVLVWLKGADVVNYGPFIAMWEHGEVAVASRLGVSA